MSAAKKVTARQAITKVLTAGEATTKKNAMKVPAIIEGVLKTRNLGLSGDNKGQTVYSILYSDNKKADGDFKSVGKGLFILNPKRKSAKVVEVTPDPKPAAKKRAPRKPKAEAVETATA